MIQIENAEDCCGCHACRTACPLGCITMVADREGFLYPQVDVSICVDCGICTAVCPMATVPCQGERVHPGELPLAFASWNRDDVIRAESSSGGVFNALMVTTLQDNGVIFGAAFDGTMTLRHQSIQNITESDKLRGSKYLQSIIGDVYQEVKSLLEKDRHVLFSGTPCQVAGLYSYLGIDNDNLLTCDLVCHGVPSPKVFASYMASMEHRHRAKTNKVVFRRKAFGWKHFSMALSFDNDTEYCRVLSEDPFMFGFLGNIYLRPSCHACNFSRLPRVADISLGDFWGVGDHHPEWDNDQGTSLVLVQTTKGQKALDACRDSLVVHEADLTLAIRSNHCICGSVPPAEVRAAFFNDLERLAFEKVMKKYMVRPTAWLRLLALPKRLVKYSLRWLQSL